MTIRIDDERRQRMLRLLQGFFREQFDEELSAFRAGELVEFFLTSLGPQVYNQAVQDARKYMQEKLDDLEGDVYVPEEG
jgi:uncharacterized protein (DUF2164 family)